MHRKQLRDVPLFARLNRQDLDMVAQLADEIDAREGEVLARQGGPADKFFIVVEGELELVVEEDGKEQRMGSYGRGHFFGETSVMRESPRSATIRAAKASSLLTMERDDFRDLVAEALGTTGDFDKVIQERLRG
jgi:voltage-gated potassium channel